VKNGQARGDNFQLRASRLLQWGRNAISGVAASRICDAFDAAASEAPNNSPRVSPSAVSNIQDSGEKP
jgi:hypothetical protein